MNDTLHKLGVKIEVENKDGLKKIDAIEKKMEDFNRKKSKVFDIKGGDTSGIQKIIDKISNLNAKLKSVGSGSKVQKVAESFKAVSAQIKASQAAAREAAGLIKPTQELTQIRGEMADTILSIHEVQNAIEQLEKTGGGMDASADIAEYRSQLEQLNGLLAMQRQEMSALRASGGAYTQTAGATQGAWNAAGIKGTVNGLMQSISSVSPKGLQAVSGVLSRLGQKASVAASKFKNFKDRISNSAAGVKGWFDKLSTGFGKFISKIPLLGKLSSAGSSARNAFSGLGAYIGRIVAVLFSARAAINAAREGFGNLAQYSSSTNNSISMLMSSLLQLKNALASAFAPILDVVAPILNQFIQYLVTAANAVAHFFAAITGKGTVVTAKAVNKDYAASVAGTASAMGDAADKTDKANQSAKEYKRTLMGFDQINKLDEPDSGSGKAGSGGSGGGGDISARDMFQTETINGSASKLAEMFKEAWAKADFTDIGAMLGNRINKGLQSIPWEKIKSTSRKIASSIATFLNGFLEATDWHLVGATVGEGINTAIEFGFTFVHTFHWDSLGKAIGDYTNGIFTTVDWGKAGQTISDGIHGIITTFETAIDNTDWRQIGVSIMTFIGSIDWLGLLVEATKTLLKFGSALLEIIIGAIEDTDWSQIGTNFKKSIQNIDWQGLFREVGKFIGNAARLGWDLIKAIGGAIVDGISGIGNFFKAEIEGCGGNIIEGIFNGIVKAVKGIGLWIKTNIFDPFIDGFKEAFGIHSPSTVMETQGGYLIGGLLNGLLAGVANIGAWVKTNICDRVTAAFKLAGYVLHVATSLVKKGWSTISGFVGDAVSVGVGLFKKGWSKLSDFVGTTVTVGVNLVKGAVGRVRSWLGLASGGVYSGGAWHPVQYAAGGGSFNQGQFFVAREAGPELVGTIGGHSAVMNNDQIVASVSAGVYKAVTDAMREKNNKVSVYLQGDAAKFFSAMQDEAKNYTNATGLSAFPV